MPESKDLRPIDEIDDLDRRILETITTDARLSNTDIAAAVGVAPSTVHGRLRSLVERGVITDFMTSVNQRALGLPLQAIVGVTLRPGARQASIVAFSEEVRRLPQVLQVFFLGGVDDFIIHIAVEDSSAVRTFVVEHLSAQPSVASTRTSIVFDYHRNAVAASFQ
ncbi:DNA-binding Lrp family transcriptional regulator [Frondihabitans sp. PhB188]|uniref:Lrp/AsnC family transcriptional regulator n=1 Tax=Frondihabitans sp. PhB188 TaxID=2485200 RepID=UPI000F46FFDE|nr:Lrp/AsnC family transcriptional regulator [Frondihabitans sp. PhB188]ROQ40134.1 DNA-binding Lrp family transcriptional regulator [Frondihabitans sp. PhB188]